MEKLQFGAAPVVHFARCVFYTPIVIRYKDTPMVEVVRDVMVYTPRIPIYAQDGTHLASVKGVQIQATEAGRKVPMMMRYLPDGAICEVNKKAIFDIRKQGAAALRVSGELHTPDGTLLCFSEDFVSVRLADETELDLMSAIRPGNVVQSCTVGLQIGEASRPQSTAFNYKFPAFVRL